MEFSAGSRLISLFMRARKSLRSNTRSALAVHCSSACSGDSISAYKNGIISNFDQYAVGGVRPIVAAPGQGSGWTEGGVSALFGASDLPH
jgi:hypothetical protein